MLTTTCIPAVEGNVQWVRSQGQHVIGKCCSAVWRCRLVSGKIGLQVMIARAEANRLIHGQPATRATPELPRVERIMPCNTSNARERVLQGMMRSWSATRERNGLAISASLPAVLLSHLPCLLSLGKEGCHCDSSSLPCFRLPPSTFRHPPHHRAPSRQRANGCGSSLPKSRLVWSTG